MALQKASFSSNLNPKNAKTPTPSVRAKIQVQIRVKYAIGSLK